MGNPIKGAFQISYSKEETMRLNLKYIFKNMFKNQGVGGLQNGFIL